MSAISFVGYRSKKKKHRKLSFLLNFGIGFTKAVLFLTTLCINLIGVSLVVSGILVLTSPDLSEFREYLVYFKSYTTLGILTLLTGLCLLIPGFSGCCGSLIDTNSFLLTFIFSLSLIVIGESIFAGVSWNYIKGDQFPSNVKDAMKDLIERSKSGNPDAISFIKQIETTFDCCGGSGMDDYLLVKPYSEHCLKEQEQHKKPTETDPKKGYPGCGTAFQRFLLDNSYLIGMIALGILLVELLALGCAVALYFMKKVYIRWKIMENEERMKELSDGFC